jgi:hypothetical protein
MAKCAHCKTDTYLFENNVPICLNCAALGEAKERSNGVQNVLMDALRDATKIASIANRDFNDVIDGLPSGLPYPDGATRVNNASKEISAARIELMKAHNRLNDFLSRGTVPEDLK